MNICIPIFMNLPLCLKDDSISELIDVSCIFYRSVSWSGSGSWSGSALGLGWGLPLVWLWSGSGRGLGLGLRPWWGKALL